jgi:hypothetical protein
MRTSRVRPLLVVLVLLSVHGMGGCAKPMPPFQQGSTAHGRLGKHGAHWVLELDGRPEERGKAAGVLVGAQVRWLLAGYLKKIASTDRLSPMQKEAVAAMAAGVPSPHFAELNALAEAAGVDRTALFAANLAPEVLPLLACSCLATAPSRSSDGRVRLARNLDWPGGEVLSEAAIVVVESGAAHRFASFTWPGLVGVATGMNDAGLAVADLMALATGGGHPRPGLPVLFAVRGMLEKTDSVEAALDWLEQVDRTMPQNYALADATGVRVVETSKTQFRVRPATDGIAAITNYWKEEQGGAKDPRYATMMKTAGTRPLGLAELQAILAGAALEGDLNVQAVVLEPATRMAYVAQGKPPVARATWPLLDLSPWLGTGP